MPIYTVRTTSGRESIVIDMLESKLKAEGLDIKTIFHPAEIKGYIFLEGSLGQVQKLIKGVMHIRGLIEKPVPLAEIQRFLEYKKEHIQVNIDDIVEIIGGPFKGEKGKIIRIDKVKNEVTVELLEATIPIPVTITTEFVKVIKSAKKPETAEAAKPEAEEEKPSILEEATKEEPEEDITKKSVDEIMEEARKKAEKILEETSPEAAEKLKEPTEKPATPEEAEIEKLKADTELEGERLEAVKEELESAEPSPEEHEKEEKPSSVPVKEEPAVLEGPLEEEPAKPTSPEESEPEEGSLLGELETEKKKKKTEEDEF